MNLYARNVLALMRMSCSSSAKFLAIQYEGRVERFLEFISLNADCIISFAEGSNADAEKTIQTIFRYGWLSPHAEFIQVQYALHESTVRQVTGYSDCDTACEAGWIKFTVGLPYNHRTECLFEPGADKSLISGEQRTWLNTWVKSITVDDEMRPIFRTPEQC